MAQPGDPVLLRPAALGGAGIGDWFCVTVVRPHADPLRDVLGPRPAGPLVPVAAQDYERLADVAARIGADPAGLAAWDRDLSAFWDADDAAPVLVSLVVPAGGPDGAGSASPAVVLLEVNGFEGSRPEVLAALSRGGRAWSLFRGVHSSRLSHAADGRVLVTLDPSDPHGRVGAEPDALGDALDALLGGDVPVDVPLDGGAEALALALVQRAAGVALDAAWWHGSHLVAGVVPVDDHAHEHGLPPAVEDALDEVGRQAAADPEGPVAELLLSTLQDAVRAALHFTGLADDAAHGPALTQAVGEARILRRIAVEARPAALEAAHRAAQTSPDAVADPDARVREESVAAQQRLAGTLAALWDDYGPARCDGVAGSGRPGAPPQVDDERWHRLQAGIAVTELLAWAVAPANPYDDAHSPVDVLLHVRFALAHRWDPFEDALAAHLEDRLG